MVFFAPKNSSIRQRAFLSLSTGIEIVLVWVSNNKPRNTSNVVLQWVFSRDTGKLILPQISRKYQASQRLLSTATKKKSSRKFTGDFDVVTLTT